MIVELSVAEIKAFGEWMKGGEGEEMALTSDTNSTVDQKP